MITSCESDLKNRITKEGLLNLADLLNLKENKIVREDHRARGLLELMAEDSASVIKDFIGITERRSYIKAFEEDPEFVEFLKNKLPWFFSKIVLNYKYIGIEYDNEVLKDKCYSCGWTPFILSSTTFRGPDKFQIYCDDCGPLTFTYIKKDLALMELGIQTPKKSKRNRSGELRPKHGTFFYEG